MGSCFCFSSTSTTTGSIHLPTAKVVAPDGTLREYTIPATTSDVLGSDTKSFFLCNSDKLFFDARIPALSYTHLLEPDQIYFVLPKSKLDYLLTATDMAVLAAKAWSAMAAASRKRGKSGRIRVEPVGEVSEGVGREGEVYRFEDGRVGITRKTVDMRRSGSAARMEVISRVCSRQKLRTIEEVAE